MLYSTNPDDVAKKSKGLGGRSTTTLSALEPFSFLITSSPRYWACAYDALCDWMSSLANDDFKASENPFSLLADAAHIVLAPTSPTRDSWLKLQETLNTNPDVDSLWAKLTVVDKVLTMFGEEDWSDKNLQFFALQHNVWWVSQAQSWLSLGHVRTSQEYIQTAMSALIMELLYRFVWARYTKDTFMKYAPAFTGEDIESERDNSDDDVLEASDLENPSDSESQSVASDSSFCDSENEEGIVRRDDMGKLKHFFSGLDGNRPLEEEEEEDIGEEMEESEEEGDNNGKKRSAMNIESEHLLQYASSEAGSEHGGDWLDKVPPATTLFFAHPRISEALEIIEKQYFVDDRFDVRASFEILLRLCLDRNSDLQLPTQTPAQVVSQMAYAYDKVFLPFLTQMGISTEVPDADLKSESGFFDSLAVCWTFNWEYGDAWVDRVLRTSFANLTTNGSVAAVHFIGLFPHLLLNADSKTDAHISQVYDTLHTLAVSKGTITPHLENLIKTLDSLSAERNVLIRQNKAQSQAPLASKASLAAGSLNNGSSNAGNGSSIFAAFVPSTDSASASLKAGDDEEDDSDPDAAQVHFAPGSLEERMHKHRLQRIKQIDTMIEEIRTEASELTGHVDSVQSKRRARRSKADIAEEAAAAEARGASAPAALLQSEEELWGLPTISKPE